MNIPLKVHLQYSKSDYTAPGYEAPKTFVELGTYTSDDELSKLDRNAENTRVMKKMPKDKFIWGCETIVASVMMYPYV